MTRNPRGGAMPVPWWGSIYRGPGRELEMRWARWAVRHYAKYLPDDVREAFELPRLYGRVPPLTRRGEPTPIAEQAERWGVPIPMTSRQAAEIARRGYKVLAKWRQMR